MENRLSLLIIATLILVTTPLFLGMQRILAFLVLWHFVEFVLATFLAESPAGLRNVDRIGRSDISTESNLFTFIFTFLSQISNQERVL